MGAVAGTVQAMTQDRPLDLCSHAVSVRPPNAGQAVKQSLGPVGPEVAADLLELLPDRLRPALPEPHDPAGLNKVVQHGSQLHDAELATSYSLFFGHAPLLVDPDVSEVHPKPDQGRQGHT